MSWERETLGTLQGYFIDGYFRSDTPSSAPELRREMLAPYTDALVFGAVVRLNRRARNVPYKALRREFVRDPNSEHSAFTFVLTDSVPGREFLDEILKYVGFEVKLPAAYEDYAAYQRDVAMLVRDVLSVFAAPAEVGGRLLINAGLDVLAVMKRKES